MRFLLCAVWVFLNWTGGEANFTFTYDMAKRCKEHLSQHGYSYETYYHIDSEDLRKFKKSPDVVLELHLAILAASNGHILLSTVPLPASSDPVYEIVIGGGGNKFTELRRNLRRNARASAKTVGILSTIEFRAFYIKITEDGLIEFGREGEELPVITYQDVNPLTIRYFSFAAWNGVEAKFLYDCPRPGDKDSEVTPNSEAIEPQLSNTDSLKRSLLLNRDPVIPPAQKVEVQLAVQINSVNYNAFESKLTTGLSIVTSWMDNSMAWNPSKFNDTAVVTFRQGQIWSPKFFVFNSDSSEMLNPRNPETILTVNDGLSTYHFQTQVVTWCYDYNSTMNQWPRDRYECALVIEPWEAHEKIILSRFPPHHRALNLFAEIDEVVRNGWDVTTKQFIVNASIWTRQYISSDNDTHQSDRFVVNISLTRKATAYNIVFYTPLIVLVMFVLMSFWTEPLTLSRVWFYAGSTIVICMGLSYIDYLIPCHTVPSILYLYTTVLGGVLIALLIHVALMTAVVGRLCKTIVVQNILTTQCFRTLFCLPTLKTCQIYESINEICPTAEEDDSGVIIPPRNGNVEEMQSDKVEYSEKKEIAEVIDKISFLIYSVVFAVMLAMHF
ncbi:uncharacterized protein NtR [Epargyreus clarus]|uniref:uncharacterized protein NtR n=1 Tax=Epargyreus clarus TaxID=520877 RepID=UPI003C2C0C4C